MTEVIRQILGRSVTVGRTFLKALQADGLEFRRKAGPALLGGNRIGIHDQRHGGHRVLSTKRRLASQQFIERRAEGIDVGLRADFLCPPGRLFGSHVAGRPQDRPGHRRAVAGIDPLCQSEIGDFRLAFRVE